jgi:hypothetical protein
MTRPSDTSPEAEAAVREAYRRMPFDRKWRQMGAIYRTARALREAGRAAGGGPAPSPGREADVSEQEDNLRVLQEVIAALTRLGVPYALGGSWASSLLGKMRFTHDADLTVEPFPGREAAFCACFGEDYYVSLDAVRGAIRLRASFNVVHLPSAFKVDCFVRKERPFDRSVMARRRPYPLPDLPGQSVECVTAEDVVLMKLEWYRLGDEASEQQFRDVLGVLQVQAGRLDDAYLDRWAADLGVADLLARARREAGG